MKTRVAWVLLTLVLGFVAHSAEPPAKRALLIGIDSYPGSPPLRGAGNDLELLANVLTGRFGVPSSNIRVLRDSAATAAAIRTAFAELATLSRAGDTVIVHFSGYGSQLPEINTTDELDGLDETIVPFDADRNVERQIRDNELDALMNAITKTGAKATLILDTCYAAESTRGGAQGRCLPRAEPAYAQRAIKPYTGVERASIRESRSTYNLLSAAQNGEIANEAFFGGASHGVFTYELSSALASMAAPMLWRQLFDRTSARVRASFPSQDVTFEIPAGKDVAPLVFDDGAARAEFAAAVTREGGIARVGAGISHGLKEGTRLEFYPAGTADFTKASPIGALQVEKLGALVSYGRLLNAKEIPAGAIARLTVTGASPRISVFFDVPDTKDPADQRVDILRVRETLKNDPRILVVKNPLDAQLQVTRRPLGLAVLSGDETPLSYGLAKFEDLLQATRKWVHWYSVVRFANPTSALRVNLLVTRDGASDPLSGPVRPGDILAYSVANNSEQPVYVQTWLLSSDGSIVNSRAGMFKLKSGETSSRLRLGTFLPEGARALTDYVKVFASDKPFDLTELANPAEPLMAERFKTINWTTQQVSYELRQRTTHLAGFVMHRDDAGREAPAVRTDERVSVCRKDSSRCLSGRVMSDDGSMIFLDSDFGRAASADPDPGVAFQQAYDMEREADDRVRVEPLFEVVSGEDLLGLDGRSGGSDVHDPAAVANKFWNLEFIKAPAARALLRTTLGRKEGMEAEGVRIAHLDTGYTNHPELFVRREQYTTILPGAGLDLVDGGDPYDTLVNSGLLPNPGHGTGSGSVIVSPPGCQMIANFPDGRCIDGVAPGAQLIPVRVNTSVVVFNQRRMTDAILAVAEGRVQGSPRIISIAMGGPPTVSLWRAVRKAEAAGILIVAAAGNNVGTVVWPARFDSTIAVGAVNIRCVPWKGSSAGRRVDISAPGESVWRAQIPAEDKFVIAPGTGTTFATSNTTGAAALWVARFGATPQFDQLVKSGGLTETFRRAVRATAWRPLDGNPERPATCAGTNSWNDKMNGAGILDAERLVKWQIDASTGRSGLVRSITELPLFSSLYPRDVDAAIPARDYAAILSMPAIDIDAIKFETEILYQYATNDVVRAALDRVVNEGGNPANVANVRKALALAGVSRELKERVSGAQK